MARGDRGGRRGGRHGDSLPREVQVSKKMSFLLRHGAEREGLKLDKAGYLNVADLLNNHVFRSMKVTFEEVQQVVQTNDKQRFTMIPAISASLEEAASQEATEQDPIPSNNPKDYLIRANQGHSLKVESEGLLKPITKDDMPQIVVHGTTHAAWRLIASSGGLKPMGRNHIHFASGLPAGFKSIVDQDQHTVEAPVISGMRKSSTVLVYLDLERAMDSGIQFGVSDNGVILTEGNEDHVVPIAFFKRVEDRTGEGILVENGDLKKAAPEIWASKKAWKT